MKELTCKGCQQQMDVEGIPPFTLCQCSDCETEIIIPFEMDFLLLEKHIGKRGLFEMYEGFDLQNNTISIIYILEHSIQHYDYYRELAEEQVKHLKNLKSKYISPILNFGDIEGNFFITEPKIDGFDLSTYSPEKDGLLDIKMLTDLYHDLACALAVAHREGLIHHDIAAENIHIDNRKQVRLKNFFISNVSYKVDMAHKTWQQFTPSPYYISPEKLESFTETDAGDIYSLGVMFYFLLTGYFPYEGNSIEEVLFSRTPNRPADSNSESIEYHEPQHLNIIRKEVPQDISFIVMKMLSHAPDKRPKAQQIIDAITYHKSRKEMVKVELAQQTMTHTTTRAIPIMRNLGNLEQGKVKKRKKLKQQTKQDIRNTLNDMTRQVFDNE